MPTLKPQSYAALIETGYKVGDGETLAQHFDLQHSHSRFLFGSLPDGDNSLDYVSLISAC